MCCDVQTRSECVQCTPPIPHAPGRCEAINRGRKNCSERAVQVESKFCMLRCSLMMARELGPIGLVCDVHVYTQPQQT